MTRCRAVLAVLGKGVVLSHVTALRLLGVEVPHRLADDDRIHVVTTSAAERPRRSGVVAHHTRQRLDVIHVRGMPITSPAQTWVQVSVGLLPDDVVVLGDAMMRRKHPLVTTGELTAVAERTHKVKGIVLAREQIPRMRPRTDSSTETRTRLVLTGSGLPCPLVNEPILDEAGGFLALPDMQYPQWRIAIEYDGDLHRTDKVTWRRDVTRYRRLAAHSWTAIRVVADDLRDPTELLTSVRSAIRAAETRPITAVGGGSAGSRTNNPALSPPTARRWVR